jgi:hypothetical protein
VIQALQGQLEEPGIQDELVTVEQREQLEIPVEPALQEIRVLQAELVTAVQLAQRVILAVQVLLEIQALQAEQEIVV